MGIDAFCEITSTSGLKYFSARFRAIHELDIEVLGILASRVRLQICELLRKGVDHPDDLAKRLKVSRQAVDKHLLTLLDKGLVDRSAIFPTEGRPKVIYAVSAAGGNLLDRLGEVLMGYRQTKMEEFRTALGVLDDDLAGGRLDEEVYLKRRRALEKQYGEFLAAERDATKT